MGIQFNQELSGTIGSFQNITPPINTLTPQSTMNNLNIDFVTGKKLIQKPRGNILTGALAITVSSGVKINHQNKEFRVTLQRRTPQFIRIIKDETKIRRSRLLRFIN